VKPNHAFAAEWPQIQLSGTKQPPRDGISGPSAPLLKQRRGSGRHPLASFSLSRPRAWQDISLLRLWPSLALLALVFPACHRRERPLYAVIPKGQANVFWQTVHAGAAAEAREAGVDIAWNGPALETDYTRQITVLDDFINRHVDGIVLAPNDRKALVPAVARAKRAGIALTIIDSGADTDDYVSFIATDNYGGGAMAAKRLAEILGGKGKVAMIAVAPGSASTLAREQGFTDTLKKDFPALHLAAWQYGMSDYTRSLSVTEDILTAHPDIEGIFASNEASTVGAAQALKERGLAGKVKVVGFDSSSPLLADLKAGAVDSLVLQDPFQMAYQGLKTLIDNRAGRKIPKRIDLQPTLVTRDNLDEPRMQQLLNPALEKYLSR
jgi:ribose transport system substrate-binding protein